MSRLTSSRRPTPKRAAPRHALIEQHPERQSWVRHGLIGVGVGALGLAVAGSWALTGSAAARHTAGSTPAMTTGVSTGHVPAAFNPRAALITRDAMSLPLDGETIDPRAAAQAQAAAAEAQQRGAVASTSVSVIPPAAAGERQAALKSDTSKTRKFARELAADAAAKSVTEWSARSSGKGSSGKGSSGKGLSGKESSGKEPSGKGSGDSAATGAAADRGTAAGHSSLPITTGYSVGARFGQIGVWARYHTGFDFACPIGTPIHAAASGVVTNAGRNGHASWAGNYVTIRHADGTQTLYAHMADTTVSDGQKVTGGQVIGHVGMTGRSFGPHVHFEVYPAGITPGDVYKAINPVPWLEARGLHP